MRAFVSPGLIDPIKSIVLQRAGARERFQERGQEQIRLRSGRDSFQALAGCDESKPVPAVQPG